jgi:hypothetical protein
MDINPTGAFKDYSQKVIAQAEMNEISSFMGQLQETHQESKEETDKINEQTYSG